jgi:DNA-binding GntR family transcriptional regulator
MRAESERERVAAALEEDIVFGRLKPRERLVEQDIMDRLHTRRHVVRTALEILESKGLVERRANRGAAVRDLCQREVEELYFMRELLHRAAAEQTPLPLGEVMLSKLRQVQTDHDAAVAAGDLSEAFRHNERFHLLLNRACGNQVLEEALNIYNERTNLVRSFAFRSQASLQRSADEHHRILQASARADRQAFVDAILQHFLGVKASYQQDSRR